MNKDVAYGTRFGRLTYVSMHCKGKHPKALFLCDCGKEAVIVLYNAVRGNTKSCGCLRVDFGKAKRLANRTHGQTGTPTYSSWAGMKARCFNANHQDYKYWGAKGITVCERWVDSFSNFLEDMGHRPAGKSLDRIDNNGNYCKENCRWATTSEQSKNRGPMICPKRRSMSFAKAEEIRAAKKAGLSWAVLCKKYDVNKSVARSIVSMKSYKMDVK